MLIGSILNSGKKARVDGGREGGREAEGEEEATEEGQA